MREPPNSLIASNCFCLIRPKRVSRMLLSPPTPPLKWHLAQETSLKTGPRPSSGVSSSMKSSLPSLNRSISSFVSPDNGSPNFGGATAIALPVSSTASPNMIHDPHVVKLGCHPRPREVRMDLAPLRRQIGRAPTGHTPYRRYVRDCAVQHAEIQPDLARLRSCYLSGLQERTVRKRRGLEGETREGF